MGDGPKAFDVRGTTGETLPMAPPHPNAAELADRHYDVLHPLRPMLTAGFLSLGLFVLACLLSYAAVRSSPPPLTMPLLAYAALFITLWAVGMLVLAARQAGPAERVRIWSRLAVFAILGTHIACFGLIWGIMPHVSEPEQLLLAIPLIGCAPMQLICSPENSFANRAGVIGVIGSLGLFFATRGTELGGFAALYIGGFGIVMFILADRIAAVVRATVAARLASDAAAAQLDRLVGEVAAQRDAKTRFMASA